jgi:hypothetical protein
MLGSISDWVTGYHDSLSSWCPWIPSAKCWGGSQVPSCYCDVPMQPWRFKFIRINLLWPKVHESLRKVCNIWLLHETKIPRLLSQATASNHPILYFAYQKDERVRPGNLLTKRRSFLIHNKTSLILHTSFSLLLFFLTPPLSLSRHIYIHNI